MKLSTRQYSTTSKGDGAAALTAATTTAKRMTPATIAGLAALLTAILLALALAPGTAWAGNNGAKYRDVEDDEASIWFIFSDNQGYQVFDTYEPDEDSYYNGATYDASTNTLTLQNVSNDYSLVIDKMGEGLTLNVVGNNTIGCIDVNGYEWGAGLKIVGTGSLTINPKRTYSTAIDISGGSYINGADYYSKAKLNVAKDVTLKAYSGGGQYDRVIFISRTTVESFPEAISFGGSVSPALTSSNTSTLGGTTELLLSSHARYRVASSPQPFAIAAKTATGKYFAVKNVEETLTDTITTYDIYEVIDFGAALTQKGALLSTTMTEAQFGELTNYQAAAEGTTESYLPISKNYSTNINGEEYESGHYGYPCTKNGKTYYVDCERTNVPVSADGAWSEAIYTYYEGVGDPVVVGNQNLEFTYFVPTGTRTIGKTPASGYEMMSTFNEGLKAALAQDGYTIVTSKRWNPLSHYITASQITQTKATITINPPQTPQKTNLSGAMLALSASSKAYTGKVWKPSVTVKVGNKTLAAGTDYTVSYSNASPKAAGTYSVTVTGKGNYTGTKTANFTIKKAANPMVFKNKAKSVKYAKLKKSAQTVTIKKATKAKGTVTYTKAKGNKNFTVNKKTGKITIKKGTKKGVYTIKVKATAKGNANYKAASITNTIKITIK